MKTKCNIFVTNNISNVFDMFQIRFYFLFKLINLDLYQIYWRRQIFEQRINSNLWKMSTWKTDQRFLKEINSFSFLLKSRIFEFFDFWTLFFNWRTSRCLNLKNLINYFRFFFLTLQVSQTNATIDIIIEEIFRVKIFGSKKSSEWALFM